MSIKDQIEKTIILRAPRARVWRALTDVEEFGAWFGVRLDAPFAPGAPVRGVIVPTTVDTDVARQQQPYEGMPFRATVEHIEPQRLFSFRWHPFDIDRTADRSAEPETLVTFRLEDAPDGVQLRITETGFERLPAARRDEAWAANHEGWAKQIHLIKRYLERSPVAVGK